LLLNLAGRSSRRAVVASLLALLCSACAGLAGPDYQRPDTPVKAQWSQSTDAPATIRPDWWKNFQDPELDLLIQQALSGSIDLAILTARVNVARATIGQAEAAALPSIGALAGVDHFSHTQADDTTRYSLGADVNWELDLWGKIEKGVEAQKADFKATEAEWRAGWLTLISDVAGSYFRIRQFDEMIDQQRRSLDRARHILGIYEAMHREGLVPKTQVLQQKAEINRLEKEALEFTRLRTVAQNGLATLVGVPANTLAVPKAHLRQTVHAVDVPAGLPSQLLARRPDILAAEYRVLQTHNLTGQARLARLPSLSLTSREGTAAFSLGDLFEAGTFGLTSALSFPIFDPNIRARIRVSEAQTKVTEQQYRRTVVGAFEEVENALTNLSNRKAQQVELEQRREHLDVVSAQVDAQLKEGMVSQLQVFEVERTLLDAEQELLINHWQILTDTVALYKALGGGWPEEAVIGRSDTDKE
jgi:NodT family efflux transporter outer membrane factor (OMF) lipoprotein